MDTENNFDTQYNNFDDIYSDNLSTQDDLGNRIFYQMIDFGLSGKEVLDIGCGDGTDCNRYAKAGARVSGIEPSVEFVAKAKSKFPGIDFGVGVGEHLPYPQGSFDVVFSKYAIQTSPNVPGILSEAARVLRKGGLLVFLSKHPIRQLLEQDQNLKNYFQNKVATSVIYDGRIVLREPSHSFAEYFNRSFFDHFEMLDYKEWYDFPASEQLNGHIYPTFFVVKARRK
jgi:ubiquinone/menaquinone biosynthesis C-methylase UbiE